MNTFSVILLIIAFIFFCTSCVLFVLLVKSRLSLNEGKSASDVLAKRVKALTQSLTEVMQKKDDLERVNEVRSKYISVVAHDLKQPITLINGYSSLLKDNLAEEDLKLLANIDKASRSIERLTNDLSDVSAAEHGKIKLSFKEFIFNDIISDMFERYRKVAAGKQIELSLVDYPEPIVLVGDRFRLEQVFSNIISNALKFTPPNGSVEIRYTKENGTVKTFIQDNGMGISHIDRSKIFDKFQQSDFIEDDYKQQGWGLGLSIAEEIVSGHGGIISADSAGRGGGAMFWVVLPLNQQK